MCLLSVSCMAQNGFLRLQQDPRIDSLIMKQRQIYANDSTIDGFRVQIFMELGNDAVRHADSVKAVFETYYPEVPIYLVFGQPYYRLRVGDFRTRLEAENQFQQLKNEFPNSFVTADRINLPYNPLYGEHIGLPGKVFIKDEDFFLDTLKIDSIINIEGNLNRNMNSIFYEDN